MEKVNVSLFHKCKMNSSTNPYLIPKNHIKKKNLITDYIKPKPIQNRKGKKMHVPINMLPPISPIQRSTLYNSTLTTGEVSEVANMDQLYLSDLQPSTPPRIQRIHTRTNLQSPLQTTSTYENNTVFSPRSIIDEFFYTYETSNTTSTTENSSISEDVAVLNEIDIEMDNDGNYIICEGVVVSNEDMKEDIKMDIME